MATNNLARHNENSVLHGRLFRFQQPVSPNRYAETAGGEDVSVKVRSATGCVSGSENRLGDAYIDPASEVRSLGDPPFPEGRLETRLGWPALVRSSTSRLAFEFRYPSTGHAAAHRGFGQCQLHTKMFDISKKSGVSAIFDAH